MEYQCLKTLFKHKFCGEKVPLVLYIKFYVLYTLAVNKVHFLREYTARSFQYISLMKTYENRQWTNNGKIISYND